ncbi:Protein YIPF1 [Pteropus alecto]|uniref:Protein YIPF n=1 Tax=Pteropus alecto TaxID=9402 RepID=L5K5V4_PTEAL|nr:Protein YIPF1 [Pteropus alecto]
MAEGAGSGCHRPLRSPESTVAGCRCLFKEAGLCPEEVEKFRLPDLRLPATRRDQNLCGASEARAILGRAGRRDPREFGDVVTSLAANPDATTISIDDPGEIPKHQPGSSRGSGREEDDELLGNDDSDKTEVFDRIKGSLLPIPGKNFVRLYIRSNPDLYGPFWICATLVFAIAISGNLSNFLIHLGEKTYHYVPEFRKVSIAATVIYAYAWLVPLALWGFLLWRNSKVMNIVSYSFLEIVCVYGYSLFIYIPTAILWIIPQKAVRWILVMMALGISGSVLAMTFWPAVREDNRRIALATIVTIVLLHMLLSVGCLAYFFDAPEMDHLPITTVVPNQTVAVATSS